MISNIIKKFVGVASSAALKEHGMHPKVAEQIADFAYDQLSYSAKKGYIATYKILAERLVSQSASEVTASPPAIQAAQSVATMLSRGTLLTSGLFSATPALSAAKKQHGNSQGRKLEKHN